MSDASRNNPPRLRLRVTSAAESILRRGHAWLFADSIREQNRAGEMGELAVIYDRNNRFLAIGLFDPDSPLRVRVLHRGKPIVIDESWWKERFKAAIDARCGFFDAQTNGYRCINGESDGWPGLVLDRYDTTFVVKIYTAAWLPRLDEVARLMIGELKPERLVLRLSRNIQASAETEFQKQDGQMLMGRAPSGCPTFLESGLYFEVDVLRGQKTGFFLDQRENRRKVGALAAGRDVLNAFSFSGGFSLYAARGGAKSVTDLDISVHALESARRNFGLNRSDPNVARCRHETIQTDAFNWLEGNRGRNFDLAILDPPSLARREAERAGAIQAYAKLAAAGVRALRPGGVLVAASCSAHVSAEEFFNAVRVAIRSSGREFAELETTEHPPDHPATFPEARYLKCLYLRVD